MAELLDSCVCWCTVRIGCIEEQVQIRMDAFKTRIKAIMELQICDNLDFFANDCFKYGCVEQIAFCHDVFKLASGGIETSAWLLAIEKRAPYRCGVWQVSEQKFSWVEIVNERIIEELKVCREQDLRPIRYEEL